MSQPRLDRAGVEEEMVELDNNLGDPIYDTGKKASMISC